MQGSGGEVQVGGMVTTRTCEYKEYSLDLGVGVLGMFMWNVLRPFSN